MGVPTPQINPTEDINQFTPFNWLHPFGSRQSGGRSTLPMHVPQGAQ
jgi:hypothetical protein